MEPFGLLFCIVLLLYQKFLLFRRQIPAAKLVFADPGEHLLPRFQIQAADVVGNLRVTLQDLIPVVPVHNGVVPDKDRGQYFAVGQNVFFELLALILGQRWNLCLELGVNVRCFI